MRFTKVLPKHVKETDPTIQMMRQIVSIFYKSREPVTDGCPSCFAICQKLEVTSLSSSRQVKQTTNLKWKLPIHPERSHRLNGLNLYDHFKHSQHNNVTKTQTKSKTPHIAECNPLVGAMCIPIFNLAIQAGVSSQLFCDHHAFAKSDDSTPPVAHGVFCPRTAAAAFALLKTQGQSPRCVTGNRERIWLRDVPSPEQHSASRDFLIDVIHVSSHCSTASLLHMKGTYVSDPRDILKYELFLHSDVSEVDATMILGHFLHESKKMPPKLLLLRFHKMLCNEHFSDEEIEHMAKLSHDILRTIAGKFGFEIRRSSGTAGKLEPQSDKDLIDLLDTTSITPRNSQGCLIVKDTFKYHIMYMGHSHRTVKHVSYSPPKPGGSFQLPDHLLDVIPILAEFTYIKMLAILIVQRYNFAREKEMKLPVASRVVECEFEKLKKARVVFNECKDNNLQDAMIRFIASFNHQHRFSMVCYPVGIHYDHFKEGDESLENRILLSFPKVENSCGRGGSVYGDDYYVFALLDW